MIWSLGETGHLWRGFRWLYPSTVINIADGNLFESCIYSMDMHVHVLKRECICWFVSLKIKTVKLKLGFFIVCWFLKKTFSDQLFNITISLLKNILVNCGILALVFWGVFCYVFIKYQ